MGAGTACETVMCPPPSGACCIGEQCVPDQSPEDCAAAGGIYRGDGSTCVPPNPCSECLARIPPGNGAGAAGGSLAQFSNSIQDLIDEKNSRLSGNAASPSEEQVGGDDIASALPINGMPYVDDGNTCAYNDDYDESCPYTGSKSPDVVYSYTPESNQQLTFDLCNSAYDTKIYVYENAVGNLVACNDDACNDPAGNPFRSIVSCVYLTAGNTYYIVIDGYFDDCGCYNLSAYFSSGCPAGCESDDCPPGAILEGEPVCGTNYVDAFNGGCNSVPNVFSNVPCNATVCGAGGNYTFNGLSYRDTDWYQFVLPVAASVTATICASFDAQLAAINGNIGCGFITIICGPVYGPPGSTLSCTYAAPAGLNWIFVASSSFSGVPCGSPYILTVDCGGYNATQSKTWGQIKGMFR